MPFLLDDDKTRVNFDTKVNEKIAPLQTAFQNNINALYSKLSSLGSTPADKTPTGISNAIQAINDSIYNKLVSLGQTPASKTVANLNAKIQKLTEITWEQALTIEPVTYTSGDETITLRTRNIPINCRDVVQIVIKYNLSSLVGTMERMGSVNWYNANGGLVGTNTIIDLNEWSGTYNKTFTPPSGAVRATISFDWGASIISSFVNGNYTLTTKYQTKVLR